MYQPMPRFAGNLFGPWYSDLPNNCAANLIIFREKKHTYTTLLGLTCLLISDIFPSNSDFHLHKWEKNPSYMALLTLHDYILISEKSATYTIIW